MDANGIINHPKFRNYIQKRCGLSQATNTTPGPAPITPHEKKDIMGSAPHTAGTEIISDENSPAPGTCTEMTAVLEAKRQAMAIAAAQRQAMRSIPAMASPSLASFDFDDASPAPAAARAPSSAAMRPPTCSPPAARPVIKKQHWCKEPKAPKAPKLRRGAPPLQDHGLYIRAVEQPTHLAALCLADSRAVCTDTPAFHGALSRQSQEFLERSLPQIGVPTPEGFSVLPFV